MASEPRTDVTVPESDEDAPQPSIRKRRTFTLSDDAYDTLSASAQAQKTNRSRLVEDLIMQESRSVVITSETHEMLTNAAAAFGTEPSRLNEELINRCGAILAWQAPETTRPIPWWMFWRRNGTGRTTDEIPPVPLLPAA